MYDRLQARLTKVMSEHVSNVKQMTNLIWLVVGILNGQTIGLSQLATALPGAAEAESRVTRIRRWLQNPLVDVWALYEPLLDQVLRDWQRLGMTTMSVIVGGTMVFGDRLVTTQPYLIG